MCYDLTEYDPFKPHYYMHWDGELELDTEPMTVDDWNSWLEFNMENGNEA